MALDARAFHAAHGTTPSLASLVTAPLERLCRQGDSLARANHKSTQSSGGNAELFPVPGTA